MSYRNTNPTVKTTTEVYQYLSLKLTEYESIKRKDLETWCAIERIKKAMKLIRSEQ